MIMIIIYYDFDLNFVFVFVSICFYICYFIESEDLNEGEIWGDSTTRVRETAPSPPEIVAPVHFQIRLEIWTQKYICKYRYKYRFLQIHTCTAKGTTMWHCTASKIQIQVKIRLQWVTFLYIFAMRHWSKVQRRTLQVWCPAKGRSARHCITTTVRPGLRVHDTRSAKLGHSSKVCSDFLAGISHQKWQKVGVWGLR